MTAAYCSLLGPRTRGVIHSLFLRGHELGGGGGRHLTHSSYNSTYVLLIFSFFIQNISKRINYIMNYKSYLIK